MHFILVTNYKKKLLLLFSILFLWILIIVATGLLINETVKYTVTVNSHLSFSCPVTINISNIYTKNDDSTPYLQASNSNYKKFIDFKNTSEGLEFSYPSIFKINEQSFPGSEILYHIDFQSKQVKMKRGFVQIWSLPYSLEKFLEESKQSATVDFINFSSKKIKVNNLEGYFWEYTSKGVTENYKALEIFLSKNSKLYRISYFMPEKEYSNDEYEMFWKIVKSLKIN
ncbi:MAG: PsbP-related protein [Ruminiclostridium sp.]